MTTSRSLDLVRATATDLQNFLKKGELTSVTLVKECLAQIKRHNTEGLKLKAVISVAPEGLLIDAAAKLDAERARGNLRGPLHGIPIIVKDAIRTHTNLGMPTSVGNYALLSATANKSAVIIDRLMENGLIVVGKTNLNVWPLLFLHPPSVIMLMPLFTSGAFQLEVNVNKSVMNPRPLTMCRSMGPMNGWSAVGGQTNSAYVEGGLRSGDGVMGHTNPCGASTGSAVGVSAGFSPIALGTEVDGSLVQPAARAALYALKPTIGSTELEGVFAVSEDFDAVGAMAKSSLDLALTIELLLTSEAKTKLPSDGYLSFIKKNFKGLSVGFVDPAEWRWPENVQPHQGQSAEQMRTGYMDVIERIRNHEGKSVYPIKLPPVSEFMIEGQPSTIMAIRHVFKHNVDTYLQTLTSSEVRSAEEIMQYNKDHADSELPSDFPEQGRLIDTLENPIGRQMYEKAMKQCHTVARDQGVDKAMEDHQLDLIAFPMDSPCPRVAAAAGYPIATVPLGTIESNGRPFGLAIIAKSGREDLLFAFMSAFEEVSKPRAVPPRLVA